MSPELDLLMFPMPGLAGAMAATVEAAGWDGIYFADTQNLPGEVYVSLGLAAAATERMILATGVTNPVSVRLTNTSSATRSTRIRSVINSTMAMARMARTVMISGVILTVLYLSSAVKSGAADVLTPINIE